ncbi:MAG: response regulator [Bacteroidota bacterium]
MKHPLDLVLLVDDSKVEAYLSRLTLEKSGLVQQIIWQSDGNNALEFLSTVSPWPELIFLDIHMPGMNGWEFAEAFQSLALSMKKASIIVMLSSSQDPDHRQKVTQSLVIQDFLEKPLSHEKLIQVVHKYFPNRPKQTTG